MDMIFDLQCPEVIDLAILYKRSADFLQYLEWHLQALGHVETSPFPNQMEQKLYPNQQRLAAIE